MRTFAATIIKPDQLTSSDLAAERLGKTRATACTIIIYKEDGTPEAERAEGLLVYGRLGIAWGADATWADVPSLEIGIEMWLNHPDEWEANR